MIKTLTAAVASAALVLSLGASASADDSARANGWDRTAPADETAVPTAPTQVSVWATKPNPRTVLLHIRGYQPEGTTHKKNGAPYKIEKLVFHWGHSTKRVVARGHVTGGDVDRIRVRFPNTKLGGQASVKSRGVGEGFGSVFVDSYWEFN